MATDLAPFRAGIMAGAKIVMAGHLDVQAVDPGTPATFSSRVLIDLLRTELGFTGVVVSDAMNMAAGAAVAATGRRPYGRFSPATTCCSCRPLSPTPGPGCLRRCESGRLPRERLEESVTRILALKAEPAPPRRRPEMSTLNSAEHQAAAQAVAAAAVTVLSGPCTGPLVSGPVRVTASGGRDQAAEWLRRGADRRRRRRGGLGWLARAPRRLRRRCRRPRVRSDGHRGDGHAVHPRRRPPHR